MNDRHTRGLMLALTLLAPVVATAALVAGCASRQEPAARDANPLGVTTFNNLSSGNLELSGNATVAGDTTVTGKVVAGSLDAGESIMTGGVTIDDALTVNSGAEITGALAVYSVDVTGTVEAADLTVGGDLAVTGGAGLGDLAVGGGYGDADGGCTFDDGGEASCDKGLTLDGALQANDKAAVEGDLYVGGGYGHAGCTLTAAGAVKCDGDAAIEGSLVVTGSVTSAPAAPRVAIANLDYVTEDYSRVTTNYGATATIEIELPAASAGLEYCFYVYAAQNVAIDPATGDVIHVLTNAAGDRIQSNTPGDSVCLLALNADTWLAYVLSGTWADVDS